MWETFIWWAFCAPPAVRMLLFWILVSARLTVLNCQCPPFSPAQCVQHEQSSIPGERSDSTMIQYSRAELLAVSPAVLNCQCSPFSPAQCVSLVQHEQSSIPGERSDSTMIQYSRAELLAVSPARLTPHLTCQLRSLELGVGLPRKRHAKRKQTSRDLSVWCFNAQSCRQIATDIHDLITESKIDVLMMTESWLYPVGDEAYIVAMTPAGYDFRSFPRTIGRGGGIAFVTRKCLSKCVSFKQLDYTSFDAIELRLTVDCVVTHCVCIYRPPPSEVNKLKNTMFLREFPELLSVYSGSHCDFSFIGDFNFHFDVATDSHVNRLKTALADHGLTQLVGVPTHRCGHILDWAVVRSEGSLLSLDDVIDCPGLSDHKAIACTLALTRPPPSTRLVTSRNIKAVRLPDFHADVKRFADSIDADADCDGLVGRYNEELLRILDQHAPQVTRRVRDRPSAPWMSDDVREARRKRRRAERRWRRTRLTVHRDIFVKERAAVRACIQSAKEQFYCGKIDTSSSCRVLFSMSNQLLGRKRGTPLPSDVPRDELPQRFSDFFLNKIKSIRDDLDSRACEPPTFSVFDGPFFTHFEPVSETEIEELISASAAKSCMLDPIPTTLLKQCSSVIVPVITDIVNASLASGKVPDRFRRAIVSPLLKKPGLDPNNLKHFRPVSNLPFVSKILERVVLKQLLKHLSDNGLLEVRQSAYRKGHSTETAVLSVLNGLLVNADSRLVSLVALLDLSAAFDTLDHSVLLKRLELTFGVRDTTLAWFTSYVQNRFQSVIVDGMMSAPCPLAFGVPQGSVLGPVLFTLYSQPLSDVIASHNCDFHKYADDTELSKSAAPGEFSTAQSAVQDCVAGVLSWMNSNCLMLNTDKTEVMPVGAPSRLRLVGGGSVSIGGSDIHFQTSVKYLGVKIDQTLSMQEHIGSVCRASFLELRRIASIRRYLSTSASAKLVSAMVTSRFDYCNSILAGLPAEQISRLQRVQNNAARLVFKKKKNDHVTTLLKELHWLPIKFRIQFKIAVLAYRHFDGSLPPYLSDALCTYQPSRSLRSSVERLLKIPKCNLKTAGNRSFSFVAPSIWNSLPTSLRDLPTLSQFRVHLKTYLFQQAFH